jgi:hypothetical protein
MARVAVMDETPNHSGSEGGPKSFIWQRIDRVKAGDKVMTPHGQTTTVLTNFVSFLGNRKLIGLNGRLPVMTEDHPVVAAGGAASASIADGFSVII